MRFVCLLALVVAIASGAAHQTVPSGPPPSQAPAVSVLLETYTRGDFQAFEKGLDSHTNLTFLGDELERATRTLRTNVQEPDVARKRLIAASVALEAVNRHGMGQWTNALPLLEWACGLARLTRTPSPAERLWHWASIAVMEGAADGVALELHAHHALTRFPDEPRFVLARAVAAELRTFPDARDDRRLSDSDPESATLMTTRFEEAVKFDATRAEASVRLGYFLLRLGKPDRALERLSVVRSTDDAYLRYLAFLLQGRANDRLDRGPEAIAAYRAAAGVVIGAQTAEIALAAALSRHGDRAEATRVIQGSVSQTRPPPDPWHAYGRADSRFWPQILRQLREALR